MISLSAGSYSVHYPHLLFKWSVCSLNALLLLVDCFNFLVELIDLNLDANVATVIIVAIITILATKVKLGLESIFDLNPVKKTLRIFSTKLC